MTIEMPKDIESERAIFSLLLMSPEKLIDISDILTASDFYLETHQEIWQAMINIHKAGQEVDIVSIRSELTKMEVDPKPAIHDLLECYEQPSVMFGNLDRFIKEVRNKSMLRKVIHLTNDNMMGAQQENAEALAILGKIEKEVIDVADEIRDDRPTDAGGILNEIREDIAKGEKSGWKGFNTGFKWLDEQTGGLIPTQCWIVGAYTGVGKTFFTLQMILNALEQGAKVALFSTEMDRKMNMMRLLGNLAGLGTIKMMKGLLDADEKNRMREAEKRIGNFKRNLEIFDNIYSLEEIRLKAKKRKVRDGLDIVVIDFIQNLRGAENIYERMSNAAISLQQIAQELEVTMIIASQVTQGAAGWQNKEAIEYKGAGEIAAISDVGLWISKVEEDKSARKVVLRKVRHGIPGQFMVRMSFPSGRIIDMDSGGDNGGAIGEEGNVQGQL